MKLDATEYWTSPPPQPSPRLVLWLARIAAGWRPNANISTLNYHDSADWYGVYIWEWLNVLLPAMEAAPRIAGPWATTPKKWKERSRD